MYKTIIFDVDGTLVNTEKAVLGSLQRLLEVDYGQRRELDELTFSLGIPGMNVLPRFGIADAAAANERWNYFMKEFYDDIHIYDGISELLAALGQRGLAKGIVTSKTREELRDDFEPFGLLPQLPHIVCADDTSRHKPHPEPLLAFLDSTGADRAASLYIGDTVYDYECARDAGVDFALALWGCRSPETIPAKHKLAQPLDVLGLV